MNYVILDTRGLLLHSYHRSTRKTIETTDGFIPSWEDGIAEFVEAYLDPILASVAPRQVLACFDGGNTARRLLYFDYKAKRGQRDKDENPIRSEQIKLLMEKGQRLLAYLGCRTVRVPGEEADDLIGLLVSRLEADHFTIYTRDKDLLQLVSDKVMVVQNGTLFCTADCVGGENNLDGTPFDLIALMKAVVGDSSDEYPGVKGCGAKFFETLLQTYGADSLRQLRDMVETWNHPKGVKPQSNGCKLMDKLIENWDDLLLFYKVAKINPANCYGANNGKRKNPEWYVRVPDGKKVHEILGPIGISRPQWDRFFPTEKLIDANRADQMQDIAGQILSSPIVSYDFETSDKLQHKPFREYDKNFVDVLSQELTSISINYGDNLQHTIYVPFDHKDTANLSPEWARWILQVLANVQPRAVVQNAAFELSVALTQLQEARRAPFDTAIMSMYVDENEENGLKAMSKAWLNYTQTTYKEVTQGRAMHELTAQEALSYGCDDSLVTGHLFDLFRHIMQLEGSWTFYAENEVDWALDSAHYFVEGTDVDYQTLHAFHTEAKKKVAEGMEQMHACLAEHCNAQKTAEVVQPLATALLDEWWSLEGGKYGEDITKAEAARQRLWEQAWNGCFYVPPSRTVEIKFSPTPVQLTAVASLIDKAIPRIDKVTQKAIEEWDIAVSDALEVAEKSRVVEPLAHEFHEALFRARKSLKKTDSVEYRELSNLCLKVLHERGNMKATLSGDQLNTNSPKQMQQLLYGKLELPIRRRSKVQQGSSRSKLGLQGGPATGIKAIAAARVYDVTRDDDWRVGVLDAYHSVAKTSQEISLYYETYPLMVHPRTGKIHPQIKNCGTTTRRPSGTAPNVLQVAKGPLRTLFRAGNYNDGERVYVSCDFAAQELVITACEAKDPVMLEAFMSNPRKDLHSLTSTGFAHTLLERMGVPVSGKLDYDTFMAWRHHEDPKIREATNKVRNKYGKAAGFLISYLGGPSTLAENLLIPLEDAKEIMGAVFDLYARMQPWQQETIEFAKSRGYTLTAYGNRRHAPRDLWASDKGLASRAGRQVVNATVQGCLQRGTKVLCKTGLKNIEDLVGAQVEVWTGFKWASAVGLSRGECQLAEIWLDSGITIRCDIRHKLKNDNLEWVEFRDLKIGDYVALPDSGGHFAPEDYEISWPFILGYWLGDGSCGKRTCLTRSKQSSYERRWFSLVGGEKKLPLLEEMLEWFNSQGFTAYLRCNNQGVYVLEMNIRSDIDRLMQMGVDSSNALVKRVPTVVWEMGEHDRRQFLYGYAMSDGARTKSPSWHTPNFDLLQEIQTLLSSLKVDSAIAETKFGFKLSTRVRENSGNGRTYPARAISRNFPSAIAVKNGDNLTITARAAQKSGRNFTQSLARRAISAFGRDEQIYRFDKIESIRVLPKTEETYTMSVDDDLHQFVADGVIHKNTAADILKVVLTDMNRREMRQRYRLKALRPVYDEITASVPVELASDYAQELIEVMSITPPGYPVGMKVDLSLGKTWGSVIEVEDTSRAGIEQALETVLK